jgi:hypothetical protein
MKNNPDYEIRVGNVTVSSAEMIMFYSKFTLDVPKLER